MHDLLGAHARLERLYRLYIRSAFPLRSNVLARERDAVLERPGVLCQPPLVETVPRYPSSGRDLAAATRELSLPYRDLEALAAGLMAPGTPLYQHQWDALRVVIEEKRDLVVTTGTGSGKTECFLLPLLAHLARESKAWAAPDAPPENRFWWREDEATRVSQWGHIRRPHAIRALVLYPLNALVEDQLRRLRATLDSDETHEWLDQNRGGNRITFGRYTGATPVPGEMAPHKLARLCEELREAENSGQGLSAEVRTHFPRLDGGEMWSRWDMQETPPDIFITNYSMLNIALMRSLENPIWEQTRAFLESGDPEERQFFLILDELHAYRGTPGTEVAYLLRLLLHRLGLTPDSPQLRILTTTASLEEDENGRRFLREFWGRDRFAFFSTPQIHPAPDAAQNLVPHAEALAHFARTVQIDPILGAPSLEKDSVAQLARDLGFGEIDGDAAGALSQILERAGAIEALRGACREVSPDGTIRPAPAPSLARALWPDFEARGDALRGLLLGLGMARGDDGRSPQPTRGHLFFHNLGGMWACLDPNCSQVEASHRAAREDMPSWGQPTVGALHASHRLACDCGARVLDFVACEVCGDAFVGGYRNQKGDGATSVGPRAAHVTLTTDQPDLDNMPDRVDVRQQHDQYAVFWPQPHDETTKPCVENWNFTPFEGGPSLKAKWQKAYLHARTGILKGGPQSPDESDPGWISGWIYHVENGQKAGAMPGICPRCEADYRRRQSFKSPLRAHRTGFQKACQVLAAGLMREMGGDEKRKLVVFSDSRQDAAKLAAGMERDHFRDMLRLALLRSFREFWPDLEAYVRGRLRRVWPDSPACEQLQRLCPELWERVGLAPRADDVRRGRDFRAFMRVSARAVLEESVEWANDEVAENLDARREWESLLSGFGGAVPFDLLHGPLFSLLLQNGLCPGGSSFGSLKYWPTRFESRPWFSCWNWADGTPQELATASDIQRRHITDLSRELYSELMYAVFRDLTRSLEALGDGQVVSALPLPPDLAPLCRAVIRQMGARRQYKGAKWYQSGSDTRFSKRTREFLARLHPGDKASAEALGDSLRTTLLGVGAAIPAHERIHLNPARLALQAPPPRQNGQLHGFRCPQCCGFYFENVGVCPECDRTTSLQPDVTRDDFDYYAALEEGTGGGLFRMNCEELTGQSDATARPMRQRHFQDVFIGEEIGLAQGIDLLSVTTTMEAGVDIGGLNAVMMANMPPRRFNYQQRVGRAGRRASGVSLALTFCRGRSHDNFYYGRPVRMTGDKPPSPYVDMSAEPIFRRVLVKEVLRQAFENVVLPPESKRGDSVHGEFGRVSDWEKVAPQIALWLRDGANERGLDALLEILRAETHWKIDPDFKPRWKQFVRFELAAAISDIVQDNSRPQSALSERLANAGLLPMFGFPTRVRLLHCKWPGGAGDWPPREGVVDRELDIAIGQFAPGSETVKDKAVHTAAGVVSFQPARGGVETRSGFSPPLSEHNAHPLVICQTCQAVEGIFQPEGAPFPAICSACGSDAIRVLDAREPHGFFTDGRPRDFDGQFDWQPRATRPTLSVDAAGQEQWQPIGGAEILAFDTPKTIYSVNDDGGKGGFAFRAAKRFGEEKPGAYLVEPEAKSAGNSDFSAFGPTHRVALLSRRETDVLLARVRTWPTGISADPQSVVGRAAWYSLAFTLRLAAGALLDVDALELEAGLWVSSRNGVPEGQAFLCDKLENGAGYCRFLGHAENWQQVMRELSPLAPDSVAARWLGHEIEAVGQARHDSECDTSCNRCLRDFGNLPYHGLLDWRLALDLARLMESPEAPTMDLTSDWGHDSAGSAVENPWRPLVEGAHAPIRVTMERLGYAPARDFGPLTGWVSLHRARKSVALLRHPLWNDHHPAWKQAVVALKSEFPSHEPLAINPFLALRRPADCC